MKEKTIARPFVKIDSGSIQYIYTPLDCCENTGLILWQRTKLVNKYPQKNIKCFWCDPNYKPYVIAALFDDCRLDCEMKSYKAAHYVTLSEHLKQDYSQIA